MIVWHVTPLENLERILAEGLKPRWAWLFRLKNGGERHVWTHMPVHLAVEPEPDFIGELHEASAMAVLKVDVDDLTLHPGEDGGGTFAVFEWIEPERITLAYVHEVG